jgi:hypothetical protein
MHSDDQKAPEGFTPFDSGLLEIAITNYNPLEVG